LAERLMGWMTLNSQNGIMEGRPKKTPHQKEETGVR
jgi:hypothetical protein